jgi:hypothetical protein
LPLVGVFLDKFSHVIFFHSDSNSIILIEPYIKLVVIVLILGYSALAAV